MATRAEFMTYVGPFMSVGHTKRLQGNMPNECQLTYSASCISKCFQLQPIIGREDHHTLGSSILCFHLQYLVTSIVQDQSAKPLARLVTPPRISHIPESLRPDSVLNTPT